MGAYQHNTLLSSVPHLPGREPGGHRTFDVAPPTIEGFCEMDRVGGSGDGGKLLCGIQTLIERCVSSLNPSATDGTGE